MAFFIWLEPLPSSLHLHVYGSSREVFQQALRDDFNYITQHGLGDYM